MREAIENSVNREAGWIFIKLFYAVISRFILITGTNSIIYVQMIIILDSFNGKLLGQIMNNIW